MPQGDRPVRRARAQPRAHPHLPADAAGAVERARRRARRGAGGQRAADLQPLRRPARAARRRRRDDGALRPAPARQAPGARAGAEQHRPGRLRGGHPRQEGRRHDRRAPRRTRDGRRPPQPARQPQAGAAQARLAGRGLRRATSTARPTRSPSTSPSGRCAPTSARRPTPSGTAAPGSSYSPVARARRSSAPPPWRRPRPPR